MDNQAISNQFLRDVLQVNINNMRLYINIFIDYFMVLFTTTDEDIDTFVSDTHSSNSAREASARIIIGSIVSTHIKYFSIELKYSKI